MEHPEPEPATSARDVSKDLAGAGALVTGGASGLGAATCRALAARGAMVAVVDRDGDRASELAGAIGRASCRERV